MLLDIDNLQYHVKSRGKGLALVCLHGFAENLNTWDNLNFASVNVIGVDLIGHGQSGKPTDQMPYNMDRVLHHLYSIIHKSLETRETPYIILGYSLGGRIALHYALRYGQEMAGLILESASYGIECPEERNRRYRSDEELAQKILKNGSAWFQAYWENLPIFQSQEKLAPEILKKIQERRTQNDPTALANTLRGTGQGRLRCIKEDIAQLTMPCLYISGELDTKYTQIGQELKNIIPNFNHITIKNSGHNTHLESPDTFEYIVNDFLQKYTRTQ